MKRKTRNSQAKTLVLSAMLAFAAVACDFEPTTSFDGFDGEANSGIIDEQGATMRGTFQGGSASAQRAQRALTAAAEADALTVYVFDRDDFEPFDPLNVDTEKAIGSAPIVNGSFTLRGLPDAFVIVFVDENKKAVGEPLEFGGVKPNHELDIVVELDGDDIILLDERRTGIDHDDLEFNGPAFDIQIEASNPMNGTLSVNQYHVVSRAGQTSIRKGNRSLTLEDIPEGAKVKVRGILETETVNGMQQVFAQEIKLQDEEDDEGDDGNEKITICHIPPGNPSNAKTKTISRSAWPAHQGHGDTMGPCP